MTLNRSVEELTRLYRVVLDQVQIAHQGSSRGSYGIQTRASWWLESDVLYTSNIVPFN